MLTSSASQYLHPDYLQPLPTTLDAKKSPLALLAQTCSSIGKDTTPSKPIIPPLEKKETDKTPDKSENKRPSSSDEKKDSGRDSKPGFRTVPPKEIPPLVPISSGCEKNNSGNSESGKFNSENTSVSNAITRPVSSTGSNSSGHGSVRGSEKGDHHEHQSPHSSSPHHIKSSSAHTTPILPTPTSLGSMKNVVSHPSLLGGLQTTPHLAYSALPLIGHHGLPVEVTTTNPAYHTSSLVAHASLSAAAAAAQSSALKASAAASSALSPYVAYARVRTPSGATTLVPVCRDPYCTNCQLTLQNSHLSSTCTAPGCSQCAHEKSLTSLTSGLGLPGASLPMLPSLSSAGSLVSSSSGLSSFHSLYHPSALTTQGLPYICNWVAGSEYCGKRFTTSEELLQHLRTHTSTMDASSLAASYGLGLPSPLSCHGHYPTPAPLSPNSLRRAYPTSLSPVSTLLGANRYHPYKSPLGSVPATPSQAFPTFSPYYSPYALYGQRLGAAAVP
ncbi:zinc finger protein Noc-like [Haliotis asinina]|uniref:zinc finger protein Noc-like n=1 Tax=Haliotis asinina TaxID=109174 RepID=UPI0035322E5D